MIERSVAMTLLLAPFLYLLGLLLPTFPADAVGVPVALGGCALVALLFELRRARWRWSGLGLFVGLLGVSAATYAIPGVVGSFGISLGAGLLLGIPLIAVGAAGRTHEPLGLRMVAFGFALLWGITLLAARDNLSGAATPVTGSVFVSAFAGANAAQLAGLSGLLTGEGFSSLPLNAVHDPLYLALAGASLLGFILVTVRPQTGLGTPLPVAPRPSPRDEGARELPSRYPFSPAQRQVYRDRSEARPPLVTWPPGILAVVSGAGAASAFLAASALAPRWTLLGTEVAALVVGLWTVLAAEVPRTAVRERRRIGRQPLPPPARVESTGTAAGPPASTRTPSPSGPAP